MRYQSRVPVTAKLADFLPATVHIGVAMRPPSMTRLIVSSLLLITACSSGTTAPNVAPTPVSSGLSSRDRIRVKHNSPCCANPSIGILTSSTRDTLQLQSGTQSHAIPRESITEIARWNVGRTHKGAGAGFGFLIGVLAGGAIGYSTACANCDGDWRPLGATAGGVLGGGAGTLAGLLFGAPRRGFWEVVR
jgi:hypothetical protein